MNRFHVSIHTHEAAAYERLVRREGTHASMVEFLDKGREGMASTFLVRLKVGPILVDAKGVSRLYRSHIARKDLVALLGVAFLTLGLAVSLSEPLRIYLRTYWIELGNLLFSLRQALFG